MKYIKYLMICLMVLIPGAGAVTIDGNPVEWGPSNFMVGDWSLGYNNLNNNDTWLPNMGIQFVVEDNINPKVITGYQGVHIKGFANNYAFYDEPKVLYKDGISLVNEPYGGEAYDLEAVYFQQDTNNVYFLVVSSLNPDDKGDKAPGDLRLNIDTTTNSGDGFKYELGVKLGTQVDSLDSALTQFGIYKVTEWTQSPGLFIPENKPARIKSGTNIGTATGFYVPCPGCNLGTGADEGHQTYVIELKINKADIGIPVGPNTASFTQFSIADNCTNDGITPIPEFPVVALPVAAIIGLVFVLRTWRTKTKEQ